jgi:hypothetical protein
VPDSDVFVLLISLGIIASTNSTADIAATSGVGNKNTLQRGGMRK